MPVKRYADLREVPITFEGAQGVTKKVAIGKDEGWEYTLRVFKILPGGHTPEHRHPWEHVNYVISGRGRLIIDGVVHEIAAKDFALVPPDARHQFQNPYAEVFEFICIVPNRGEY